MLKAGYSKEILENLNGDLTTAIRGHVEAFRKATGKNMMIVRPRDMAEHEWDEVAINGLTEDALLLDVGCGPFTESKGYDEVTAAELLNVLEAVEALGPDYEKAGDAEEFYDEDELEDARRMTE